MQQTLFLWSDLHKCTKPFANLLHGTGVDGTFFDRLGYVAYACDGCICTFLIHGSNRYGAIIIDVDFGTSFFYNATNGFAPWPNHGTNHLYRYGNGCKLRCIGRKLSIRLGNCLIHHTKDVHPACTRLLQCCAHDFNAQTFDLDIHLACRDAVFGTGNLEVHVAKKIFITKDVAQHSNAMIFHDQSHGDTGNGLLHGHTGMEEGK